MKVVTSELSREIDKLCIEKLKIPALLLMENASLKVVKNIDTQKLNSFIIICGTGNNGGDGLAVARHLYLLGKDIFIYLIGNIKKSSKEFMINYDIVANMGIEINTISNIEDIEKLREYTIESDAVIDCIFGTGLSRNVEGLYNQAISIINQNSSYTISVDVPSGFNSDTGEIMGISVIADKTISFLAYKRGFLKYGSYEITGEICVVNIGVPDFILEKVSSKEFIAEREFISKKIKNRDKYCHKGDFGRVLIISGSEKFTGAPYICTQAAVRSGAGLITLACPKEIKTTMNCKLAEAMTISFDDEEELMKAVNNSDAIAIGPGMGDNKKTFDILNKVIKSAECPLVIDADGINVLKNHIDILKKAQNKIILTPHVGEFSRITGLSIENINKNRIDSSKKFATDNNVIILLKGYSTIITNGISTIINSTGTSAMANGGMGDCLTGIIVSFIAQGYEPMQAAYISSYIHGYCGDILSQNMFCVNASHIIDNISHVIKEIKK